MRSSLFFESRSVHLVSASPREKSAKVSMHVLEVGQEADPEPWKLRKVSRKDLAVRSGMGFVLYNRQKGLKLTMITFEWAAMAVPLA